MQLDYGLYPVFSFTFQLFDAVFPTFLLFGALRIFRAFNRGAYGARTM